MKFNKLTILALGALALASCSDIDDQFPEGGTLTSDQLNDAVTAVPERSDAAFTGMYNMMGDPYGVFGGSQRADDWGIPMIHFSLDGEGADLWMPNSGYNWFSVCGEMSSRNANYANPYIRYVIPYRQIGLVNDLLATIPADTDDQELVYRRAQACAMRAFDYMLLAPYFQFNYETSKDLPCIPVLSAGVDYTNNPRATVARVYEEIMNDLNYAVEKLEGYERTTKTYINQAVAYGLRARANLFMGNFADAADDAANALEGLTPASIDELAAGPRFCNISESNWMWGITITDDQAKNGSLATPSSWLSAFSGYGYGSACQIIPSINTLLYNKVPSTDVRKGWWIDENLYSPLLDKITWDGHSGVEISTYAIKDGKMAFTPYNNVKFGMKSGIGNDLNNNDFPLMRVEEMILVEIEGLAKSGQESLAKSKLEDFVKTYRDPEYSADAAGRTLYDEIWYQRRVELWGEGFAAGDLMRLNKPLVRFHDTNPGSFPVDFAFNMPANDPWRLLRFPQEEKDCNAGIVDNEGGQQPVAGQHGGLRDGVTD